jgi:hypothetical protein
LTAVAKELLDKAQATAAPARHIRVTRLSGVSPERVHWLWEPYLPLGRPVAIEGDPGIGKSSLVAKIIAHLTSGQTFPNVLDGQIPQPFPACNVCLLTAEDDVGDTILPRVMVNGGDSNRVFLIDGWHRPDGAQGAVTMQDLDLLRQALEQYSPALLVFDPVQSFFGRRVDMNSASDTRPVLDAVIALCKAHDCTPLFVRHIGKARRDKALYAGFGSVDITAAMRSVLFLGQDPDQESRRILAQSKANNAKLGPSLAYRIVSVEYDMVAPAGDLVAVEAPRLDWDGLSPLTASDLAVPPLPNDEETSALDQARAFLVELLTDGPALANDVQKAAKQVGIAMMTIRRAKPLAGIKTRRRHLENEQNPQNARRNNFPGDQISRWLLLLAENLSTSNYPGAAVTVVRENSNVAQLASHPYLLVHALPQEDRHDTEDASSGEIYPMLVPASTVGAVQALWGGQPWPSSVDGKGQAHRTAVLHGLRPRVLRTSRDFDGSEQALRDDRGTTADMSALGRL